MEYKNKSGCLFDGAKHLDLGCGGLPRNPFHAPNVYAIDIGERKGMDLGKVKFVKANLALHSIPFPDGYFDSVSAYDFLEHIPRLLCIEEETILPFIRLMSEVYRVLKPGGEFLAYTPLYPKESAFMDPTHVNFITKNTHKYFTVPHVWATMYGFEGLFQVKKVKTVNFDCEVNPLNGRGRFKQLLWSFLNPRARQHIVWHFKALYPGA